MRIPRATYRFQFNSEFTFQQARELVKYLSDLGISDIYASPIFKARKGSIHGYDVVDPKSLNPEIGSEDDFRALVRDVKKKGMGWLQDIVPNHMAFDGQNTMLMDVFENGPSSEYYDFFDIEWNHAYESMQGRLLAPFLGQSYGTCLDSGEIKVKYSRNGFSVHYYTLVFPIKIESYSRILTPNLNSLKQRLGRDSEDFIKFTGILYMLKAFPCQELSSERHDQIRVIKHILWELYSGNREIRKFIDKNLEDLNGDGGSSDRSRLDDLLYEQFYRLAYWKVASEEINYRRFFSINELISLRMRDAEVFRRCHRLVFRLVEEGIFSGLRIDHIDGLFDPLRYLERLQEEMGGIYIVVEKILALDEDLPTNWPIQGTSGYEFMNYVNGLFCKQENKKEMERIYTSYLGEKLEYEDLIYEKKGVIVERFMMGDVDNLAHLMKKISSRDRGGCDITLHGLKRAIFEVLGFFPVYRTYISPESFSEADRRYITEAVERARKRNPDLINELEYLSKFLMLRYEDYLGENEKQDWLYFAMRFQQFTGPLMAKGFEDTTLYVYNRLISLNEVGGEPSSFGVSLEKFNAFNSARSDRWPHALSATSTHDTKRGEDVRARINVLSEIPKEWGAHVRRWRELNRKKRKIVKGRGVPSRNDEYFFYQTLIGAFPFSDDEYPEFINRVKDYIIKSIREAKVHTGWITQDHDYEQGCLAFIDAVLDRSGENQFLADFLPFQRKVAHYGMLNSLAQTLVKITSPGVPDFYQGTELWELSLVDPDNRRPVDYRKRIAYLKEIRKREKEVELAADLLSAPQDGKVKLFLTYRALKARKEYADTFEKGAYIPLEVEGAFKDHLIAFARNDRSAWAVAIAPRFLTSIVKEGDYPLGMDIWGDTKILLPPAAPGRWKEAIADNALHSDGSIPVGTALEKFPVALLVSDEEE